MALSIVLNAVVLAVTILIITKGQNIPDISILIGLPIGLGIIGGFLMAFLGMVSVLISFAVCIFALRWAFDLTTRQSVTTTAIWAA